MKLRKMRTAAHCGRTSVFTCLPERFGNAGEPTRSQHPGKEDAAHSLITILPVGMVLSGSQLDVSKEASKASIVTTVALFACLLPYRRLWLLKLLGL